MVHFTFWLHCYHNDWKHPSFFDWNISKASLKVFFSLPHWGLEQWEWRWTILGIEVDASSLIPWLLFYLTQLGWVLHRLFGRDKDPSLTSWVAKPFLLLFSFSYKEITCTHTHTHTHTHTPHTFSFSLSHIHTPSHTYSLTHTLKLSPLLSHTHTHTLYTYIYTKHYTH